MEGPVDVLAMIKPLIAMGAMVGSLILVHEAGHFLVARMFGVSVKVFSLGVGQRLFGFKFGKTDFRVSALPIGGYVRWVGADPFSDGGADDDEDWIDAKGSFIHKPAWQRLLIVAAGPVTNLVLPVFVFCALFMVGEPQWQAVVGGIVPNSIAEKAGVLPGDEIVAVDETVTTTWVDVAEAFEVIDTSSVTLRVRRGGAETTLTLPNADATDARRFGDYGLDPRALDPALVVDDPASPAGRGGARSGDRVLSVDGVAVDTWHAMVAALAGKERAAVRVSRPAPAAKEGEEAGAPTETDLIWTVDPAWLPERYAADDDTWARWGIAHGTLSIGTVALLPDGRASAAQCAGLRAGDRILKLGERDIRRWADVTGSVAGTVDENAEVAAPARPLAFVVRRDGAVLKLEITPDVVQVVDDDRRYRVRPLIGFSPLGSFVYPESVPRPYGIGQAFLRGVTATGDNARRMVEQLGLMASGGAPVSQNLGGPIAIFSTAKAAWEAGLFAAAGTLALLSISLGVINLLPVPVLDGGQIVMYAAEWVRGRPLPYRLRERLQQVGVLLLISLFLIVSVWDVQSCVRGGRDEPIVAAPEGAPRCG
jgi:regulator of sigma E protease